MTIILLLLLLALLIFELIYFIFCVIHLNLFTVTVSVGSSDMDQSIHRGMEKKRKKCSDQEKEGESSFSYQSLVAVAPVFASFVSRSEFFGSLLFNFSLWSQTFTELGETRPPQGLIGLPVCTFYTTLI